MLVNWSLLKLVPRELLRFLPFTWLACNYSVPFVKTKPVAPRSVWIVRWRGRVFTLMETNSDISSSAVRGFSTKPPSARIKTWTVEGGRVHVHTCVCLYPSRLRLRLVDKFVPFKSRLIINNFISSPVCPINTFCEAHHLHAPLNPHKYPSGCVFASGGVLR